MRTSHISKLILIIFTLNFSGILTPPQFSLFNDNITSVLAQNSDDARGKAKQMEEDAILSFQAGRVEEAIDLMESTLGIYRQLGDEKQERRVLDNFGSLYIAVQNYPKAIEYVKPSLTLAQKSEDLEAQQSSLFKLARCYRALQNNQEAEQYYQQAYQVSNSLQDSEGKMIASGSLGQIYEEAQNLDQAIASYTQAKEIAQQIQDKPREKLASSALAKMYMTRGLQKYQTGDHANGKQDIQKSANLLKEQGDQASYDKIQQMLQQL